MSVVSRGDLIQAFVSLPVTLLLMGAVLFLSAGTLQWPHDLLFLAVFLFLTLVAMAWLWRVFRSWRAAVKGRRKPRSRSCARAAIWGRSLDL